MSHSVKKGSFLPRTWHKLHTYLIQVLTFECLRGKFRKSLILPWKFVHTSNRKATSLSKRICYGWTIVDLLKLIAASDIVYIYIYIYNWLIFFLLNGFVFFHIIVSIHVLLYKASSWCSSWDENNKPWHSILILKIFLMFIYSMWQLHIWCGV